MIDELSSGKRREKKPTVIVHAMVWLGAAIAVACAPELNDYNCDDDSDCDGQVCWLGRCVPGQTANDLTNGEDTDETDAQTDGVEGETTDGSDAPTDDADTSATDTEQDADPTPICLGSLELALFEPCEGTLDGCSDGRRTTSSWTRTNEPVEVPLINGINDVSVLAYFSFDLADTDGVAANSGGGQLGVTASIDPDCGLYPLEECLDGLNASNLDNSLELTGDRQLTIDFAQGDALGGAEEWSISLWISPCGLTNDSRSPLLTALNGDQAIVEIKVGIGELSLLLVDSSETYSGTLLSATIQNHAHCPDGIDGGGFLLTVIKPPNEIPQVFINADLVPWDEWDSDIPASLPDCDTIIVGGYGDNSDIEGEIDEVIVIRRALWPYEIRAYYQSRHPFGSNVFSESIWSGTDSDRLLPQADFDDLRVVQSTGGEPEFAEIIGAYPFSDRFAERGVQTVYENFDEETGVGRFGWDGAPDFGTGEGPDHNGLVIEESSFPFGDADEFTVELWMSVRDTGTVFSYKNLHGGEVAIVTYGNPPNFGIRVNLSDTQTDPTNVILESSRTFALEDRWHHVVLVHQPDVASDRIVLYVDGFRASDPVVGATLGEMDPLQEDAIIGIGGFINDDGEVQSDGFDGRVDEVVVHDWAVDVELIRRRAQPLIPTVRFLVDATGGSDYQDYFLEWGGSDAYLEPSFNSEGERCPILDSSEEDPECCVGLLSSCSGYIGWWRFDEGHGDILFDASSNNVHAMVTAEDDTLKWVEGVDGLGIDVSLAGDFALVSYLHGHMAEQPAEMLMELVLDSTELASPSPRTLLHFVQADGTTSRWLRFAPSNAIELSVFDQSGFQLFFEGETFEWPDTWYHLAVTTNVPGEDLLRAKMEVDFSDVAESAVPFEDAEPIDFLSIGSEIQWNGTRWAVLPESHFEGRIDSVRILSTPLVSESHLHHPLSQSNVWNMEPDRTGEGCPEETPD